LDEFQTAKKAQYLYLNGSRHWTFHGFDAGEMKLRSNNSIEQRELALFVFFVRWEVETLRSTCQNRPPEGTCPLSLKIGLAFPVRATGITL
jgi:hypothetical protein